ncbi:MAG: dCTP deaminase [Chloroflexi bacterium]|nr:MAG: dCTP deaminase [Chloroflexota bacterium]
MSILSTEEIIEYMSPARPLNERLIITPLLEPDKQIKGGTVDLRLGNRFIVSKRTRLSALDIARQEELRYEIEQYHEEHYVRFGHSFVLHPRELVLSSTLEYVSFPPNLTAHAGGRSSWGRLGLSIATRPAITPGYKGTLTLELINLGNIPIVLYPCTRIIQLSIYKIGKEKHRTTKYDLSTGPEYSRIYEDDDIPIIQPSRRQLIIGLTGPMGAGKTTTAAYLEKNFGFIRLSLAHFVRRETIRRGLPPTPRYMRDIGNYLRESHGPSVLADRILEKIKKEILTRLIVIDGIRNPGEIERLRKEPDFFLIGMNADREIRYRREQALGEGASLSFEMFCSLDEEDTGGDDWPEYAQQIGKCLQLVREMEKEGRGFYIDTSGMSPSEQYQAIEDILRRIESKTGFKIV